MVGLCVYHKYKTLTSQIIAGQPTYPLQTMNCSGETGDEVIGLIRATYQAIYTADTVYDAYFMKNTM